MRWAQRAAAVILAAATSACSGASDGGAASTTVAFERSALAALVFEVGRDAQRARAETLATCMREQGFRYEVGATDAGTDAGTGLPDREYVERYGYGILLPPPAGPPPAEQRIREAEADLTPAEAEAYYTALLGSTRADAPPTPESCLGRADALVFALAQQLSEPAVVELLGAFDAAVRADPRLVALEAEWVRCVRAQGYDVGSRDEVVAELLDLQARDLGGEELAAAQRRELALARADFACSSREPEVRRQVEDEVAPRFVERLEAILLARR